MTSVTITSAAVSSTLRLLHRQPRFITSTDALTIGYLVLSVSARFILNLLDDDYDLVYKLLKNLE
jgi:hypothetical protein